MPIGVLRELLNHILVCVCAETYLSYRMAFSQMVNNTLASLSHSHADRIKFECEENIYISSQFVVTECYNIMSIYIRVGASIEPEHSVMLLFTSLSIVGRTRHEI